jgi:hypothetical protein
MRIGSERIFYLNPEDKNFFVDPVQPEQYHYDGKSYTYHVAARGVAFTRID